MKVIIITVEGHYKICAKSFSHLFQGQMKVLLTVKIPQMVTSEVAQTKLETDSGICDLGIYKHIFVLNVTLKPKPDTLCQNTNLGLFAYQTDENKSFQITPLLR